jgi:ABC-type dipeptide/oligopeptide/nickel transport system permease subunit
MSLLAGVIAPYSFETQTRTDNNKVPAWVVSVFPSMAPYAKLSANYMLGADNLGRDLFSRILYGSRISLAVAIIAPLISMTVGVTFGTISGYFGAASITL